MLYLKDKIISLALVLIIALKVSDLFVDYNQNVQLSHLVVELVLIIIAGTLFIFIARDLGKRTRALRKLRNENESAIRQIREQSAQISNAKNAFFIAVEKEFSLWGLTATEKEVALLLLKGFSPDEIATLRNTSTKTIRNHASSIYHKSECKNRYELAAYFLMK